MSDLIDTTEMYLRTIYELEEEGVVALRARIAERLHHSGPTVSQTVARMERDGLVHVSDDRHLELTPAGRSKAIRVMRKHRLAERLLIDVIGLEWEFVHDEACRWEHVMSDRVEAKLLTMLSGPLESPYGNPIPGLEELGGPAADAASFRSGLMSLPDALPGEDSASSASAVDSGPDGGRGALVVRRLGERLQIDVDLMRRFAVAGVRPGAVVVAARSGSGVAVTAVEDPAAEPAAEPAAGPAGSDGAEPHATEPASGGASQALLLPMDVARHVFVEPVTVEPSSGGVTPGAVTGAR